MAFRRKQKNTGVVNAPVKRRGNHAGLVTLGGILVVAGICAVWIFGMRGVGLDHRREEAALAAAAGEQATMELTFTVENPGGEILCEEYGTISLNDDDTAYACTGALTDSEAGTVTASFDYPAAADVETVCYTGPTVYVWDGTNEMLPLTPDADAWLSVESVEPFGTGDYGYRLTVSAALTGVDFPRGAQLMIGGETVAATMEQTGGTMGGAWDTATFEFQVYFEDDAALDAALETAELSVQRWRLAEESEYTVTCSLPDAMLVKLD